MMQTVLCGTVTCMVGVAGASPVCTAARHLCYHNGDHILSTTMGIDDPSVCCSKCASSPGCVSFTHWTPAGETAHSCRLYTTNGTLVPCSALQQGTSGWMPRPSPTPPLPPTPPTPPTPRGALNVLFIAVDDLRPAGQLYQTPAHTPNLDALAHSSLSFDNAHAQIAHCSPSRNSLLSGRTPDTIRVWNMRTNFRDAQYAPPDIVALPQHFRERGYFTTGCGKIFHPGQPPENDQRRSWSDAYTAAGGDACRTFTGGHPSNYACAGDDTVGDDDVANVAIAKLEGLSNGTIGAWRGSDQPFLVAAGLHKPHLPYFWKPEDAVHYPPDSQTSIPPPAALSIPRGMPPVAWMACMGEQGEEPNFVDFNALNITQDQPAPEALVRNLTRGYMASVTYVDRQIGRILDALDRLSLTNSTVVAVWGDHGQNLGEHNMYCKMSLFDTSTRVPLVIHDPTTAADFSRGTRTNAPAQLLDLYPTLATLAGVPVAATAGLMGRDLAPLVRAPATPAAATLEAGEAYSQQAKCYRKDQPTPHPTPEQQTLQTMMTCEFVDRGDMDFMGYSVRTAKWRYTEWAAWNGTALGPRWDALVGRELYDHRTGTDPWNNENENLVEAAEYAHVVAAMQAKLRAHFS